MNKLALILSCFALVIMYGDVMTIVLAPHKTIRHSFKEIKINAIYTKRNGEIIMCVLSGSKISKRRRSTEVRGNGLVLRGTLIETRGNSAESITCIISITVRILTN